MPGAWRAGSIEHGMTRGSRGASASGAAEGRMRVVLTDQDKPDEFLHFKKDRKREIDGQGPARAATHETGTAVAEMTTSTASR